MFKSYQIIVASSLYLTVLFRKQTTVVFLVTMYSDMELI